MSNEVYANGREISCKSAAGKSTCSFPDVCFTPPQTPATPPGVPLPYPNTGMASDTTSGSKTVQISDKEIILKDSSFFKKSTGDEAGSAPKKGVMTSQITGKVYFTSWSMDVMIEGENAVRHLDMTTHNHGSFPSNTAPWPYADAAAVGKGGVCKGMDHLKLQAYKKKCPGKGGKPRTGHHLIPGRCMRYVKGYSHDNAPVICVSKGNQHQGSHKRCHAKFDPVELKAFKRGPAKPFTYGQANKAASGSAGQALGPADNGPRELTEKEKACVAHQLDNYYNQAPPDGPGCSSSSPVRSSDAPGKVLPGNANGGSSF